MPLMHERIQRRRTAAQYARLRGLVDAQEKQMRDDPWPVLNAFADRCAQLERRLLKVQRALGPMPIVTRASDPIEQIDMRSELMARHDAALRIIDGED